MARFAEILRLGRRNIHKALGIAIDQRKPRALNLYHYPMLPAESVTHVGHRKLDLRDLARLEGFRLLKTIAEFSPKHISPHKLLIATELYVGRVWIGIREITGIDINQLKDPVGVGSGGGHMHGGLERPGERQVLLQRLRLID